MFKCKKKNVFSFFRRIQRCIYLSLSFSLPDTPLAHTLYLHVWGGGGGEGRRKKKKEEKKEFST